MKTISLIIASILLVAMLITWAPSKIYGFQDFSIGDYAKIAPQKHGNWWVPPGHFALLASYINTYLANTEANNGYNILWSSSIESNFNDYAFVDVRDHTSYCTAHIKGAINIPYVPFSNYSLAQPSNLGKLPPDKTIVVYCWGGGLSGSVTPFLGVMGYDVRTLRSSFISVVPAGFKEAGGEGCP
jgi:rhodanese-related sulfurtransferase